MGLITGLIHALLYLAMTLGLGAWLYTHPSVPNGVSR